MRGWIGWKRSHPLKKANFKRLIRFGGGRKIGVNLTHILPPRDIPEFIFCNWICGGGGGGGVENAEINFFDARVYVLSGFTLAKNWPLLCTTLEFYYNISQFLYTQYNMYVCMRTFQMHTIWLIDSYTTYHNTTWDSGGVVEYLNIIWFHS